ncbi:hypothetical protein [Candidatus Binatus sp.]|uniref:hypothetical protein n=1 Tax=Candidatus Binatus sp. TaxID=2811406 RepID=UPI003CC6D02D
MRRAVLVAVAICCCALAGCFEWTEDSNGQLKSVGLPGIPVWQAKKPSAPNGLTDMGLTPDQASKVSGPVLVVPPDSSNQLTRYHYYETGQNNCQQDLAKLQTGNGGAGGQAPYCTETPAAPPSKGTAFVF